MFVKFFECNYKAGNCMTLGDHYKLFHQDKIGDVSLVINYSMVLVLKVIVIIIGLI